MRKGFLGFTAVLFASLSLIGCDKKDDEVKGEASLMVVNASPNGSNIDATANGTVVASNLAYPNNSGYKTVAAGNANIVVKQTGTSTEILNGTMTLDAGSAYTFYVVDSAHERKPAYTRDDRTASAAGKAKIRLLHLSPNTPAIDVTINGSSSATFNNRSFNDISGNTSFFTFTEVDAAGLNLQVKLAGSSTVLATIPVITLQAGKIYTFIIKGFTGGTATQALGVEVITHN